MTFRILQVNLHTLKTSVKEISDRILRKYLGGSGLGAYLLSKTSNPLLQPFNPDTPLCFIRGLLTGTLLPTASKLSICGKSPLTGIWCESTVGGYFGRMLSCTGYDGIMISGVSPEPVYLWIEGKNVELRNASHLWGKDTYETTDLIKKETNSLCEVACIGLAGEKQVFLANIIVGGASARAGGRGGLGALMGAKKLKAVAVYGRQKAETMNSSKIAELVREENKHIKKTTIALGEFGTAGILPTAEFTGDLPIKNFRQGSWQRGADKISGQRLISAYNVKNYGCFACPIRCGKEVKIVAGQYVHGPEYETCAGFGALCLNDDLESIIQANDLCNMYGLDTISTSSAIAFAMECYEKNCIDFDCTGQIDLRWGNRKSILNLVQLIGNAQGIGKMLGFGTRIGSYLFSMNSYEYAMHVKGLEVPFHDPRAFSSMALNYATANRGACHLEGLTYYVESGAFPGHLIGFNHLLDRFKSDHKAELTIKMQDYMGVFNGLGLCKFLLRSCLSPEKICGWINLAFGWDVTADELMLAGERLFNLKRIYNVKIGISQKDDWLPLRLLTLDRKEGGAAGSLPHLGLMLSDYYRLRQWTEEGSPSKEKISQLGLGILD